MTKNLLLLLALVFTAYHARAQCTASDLIFSSYMEGDTDQNCIEVYNGTGGDIDLADYAINIYPDGGLTSTTINLVLSSTILPDQTTFRLCNAFCALPYCGDADATSGSLDFDGNDALELVDVNSTPIDCIGVVGEDPGVDWGSAPCATSQHLLVRDIDMATCSGTCLSSFEPFNWTNDSCVFVTPNLPVELSFFQAKLGKDGNVLLNWTTESELNADKFIVQSSFEGGKFEDIVSQPATGLAESTEYYNATHFKPRAGVHYYRLKMIDRDGSFEFSDVRSVKVLAGDIAISPNPANNFINVDFNNLAADLNLKIVDVSGKLVKDLNIGAHQTNVQIDLSDMAKGHYLIKTISGTDIKVFRFLKM